MYELIIYLNNTMPNRIHGMLFRAISIICSPTLNSIPHPKSYYTSAHKETPECSRTKENIFFFNKKARPEKVALIDVKWLCWCATNRDKNEQLSSSDTQQLRIWDPSPHPTLRYTMSIWSAIPPRVGDLHRKIC